MQDALHSVDTANGLAQSQTPVFPRDAAERLRMASHALMLLCDRQHFDDEALAAKAALAAAGVERESEALAAGHDPAGITAAILRQTAQLQDIAADDRTDALTSNGLRFVAGAIKGQRAFRPA